LSYGLAHKCRDKDIKITHVIKDWGVMAKYFPKYLSDYVTENLKKSGVTVHNGVMPSKIEDNESGNIVITLDNKTSIETDHIVFAIGAKPNIKLAKSAKIIEVDKNNGGIVVNTQLMIAKDLYAAGDVASIYDPIFHRHRIDHHIHAIETGTIAARNMNGERISFFSWPTFWGILGEDEYVAYGIIDSSLENVGVWQKGRWDVENQVLLNEDYQNNNQFKKKGVVYYLKDRKIIGILLWNIFDKSDECTKAIRLEREFDDLSDLQRVIPFEKKKRTRA